MLHRFAANNAPSLRLKMRKDDGQPVYLQFINGALTLDDQKEDHKKFIDELKSMLQDPTRPHIQQLVRYVDEEAALRVVEAHRQAEQARQQAARGGFSSQEARQFQNADMATRIREQMLREGATEETIAQALQELGQDMPVTEDGSNKIVRNNELLPASPTEEKRLSLAEKLAQARAATGRQ